MLWRGFALGMGWMVDAAAQTPPGRESTSSDRVVYEASFYDAYAPRTALDMINQTPGFVLEGNDEESERRGFAGAVGNVLIDGQRLSAKSQSVGDVLSRVTAREVLRIEVLRGSAVAGDASGAAVLANVVRTPTAGGGTWEAGFELTNEDKPTPTGQFGWSGRREAVEYSVGANLFTHDHLNEGDFRILDGGGEIVANRHDDIPHQNGDYVLNGQVAFPGGDNRITLTGQLNFARHDEQFTQLVTSPGGAPIRFEDLPFSERSRGGEVGVNWQRALGGWDMNLTGLATRKFNRWRALATEFAGDIQTVEFFQRAANDSGESILRGTFARNLDSGRLEFGGEAAVNTLDAQVELTEDTGEGPVPIDIQNANLDIEEVRGEAFVSHAWRINPRWSLDSRLTAETSRLSFTGDTEQSVSLTYLKPRVQLTRQIGPHQLQLRVFRDVGQLDFYDFVSTAEFSDDIIEGGNPDLRPQTAWAVEVDTDLRFSDDAALRLRLFKHFVDDVVDFVPVGPPGEQFDAPGNIGEGSILGAELTLRMPVGHLLPGGTFNVTGLWQDTELEDPLTGETRPFSDFPENSIKAELRQDLSAAKFAWGTSYSAKSTDTDFRLNEINRFREIQSLDLFAETTWIENFKIRVDFKSILGSEEKRDRRLYDPDRNGVLLRRELGEYRPGHWWLVSVSSTF